jgi:Flp pilus assembly protein TadB
MGIKIKKTNKIMKTLKTNILIPAVALCIAGVLIVGKNFWIGVSLLVVALILTVFVYVRISKRISL